MMRSTWFIRKISSWTNAKTYNTSMHKQRRRRVFSNDVRTNSWCLASVKAKVKSYMLAKTNIKANSGAIELCELYFWNAYDVVWKCVSGARLVSQLPCVGQKSCALPQKNFDVDETRSNNYFYFIIIFVRVTSWLILTSKKYSQKEEETFSSKPWICLFLTYRQNFPFQVQNIPIFSSFYILRF